MLHTTNSPNRLNILDFFISSSLKNIEKFTTVTRDFGWPAKNPNSSSRLAILDLLNQQYSDEHDRDPNRGKSIHLWRDDAPQKTIHVDWQCSGTWTISKECNNKIIQGKRKSQKCTRKHARQNHREGNTTEGYPFVRAQVHGGFFKGFIKSLQAGLYYQSHEGNHKGNVTHDYSTQAQSQARIASKAKGVIEECEQLAKQRQDTNTHYDLWDNDRDVERYLGKRLEPEVVALKRKRRHGTNHSGNNGRSKSNRQCIASRVRYLPVF